jgi:hypothetical protein
MRFKITREICVEVDSVEEVDELDVRIEDVMNTAAGSHHIQDPEDNSMGGGSVVGLDAESREALERDADEKGL